MRQNTPLDDHATQELVLKLKSSLLLFTQYFYKLRTGREYEIPVGERTSHYVEIARALVSTQRSNTTRLMINVPPRFGKSELCIHYVAWCMARYPDCNFLYVSYSHKLAAKQTQTIKQIMQLNKYKELFGVHISNESSAKDNFETTAGGTVYACGAGGTITGRGAGIANSQRFGGAIIIDDIHKPAEVTSDVIRASVNDWYFNTLISRPNSQRTPFIFIGQRLHEDDLAANLLNGADGHEWTKVILPALDSEGYSLCTAIMARDQLLNMERMRPYEFASQYQQNPQPAGGGIFKPEWFKVMDDEPEILMTFITADTAETDKTYNDATVFSFWGLYKIKTHGADLNLWGIHWLDCKQIWVEPKDLEAEFLSFWVDCSRHKVVPHMAAIEKKSTGTTLVSVLKGMQGIKIFEIERSAASGSKIQRFLETQPYIAAGYVSFTEDAKHMDMCIEHMRKITANDTHRNDDIADTCADAVRLALIDKTVKVLTKDNLPNLDNWNPTYQKRMRSWNSK